MRPESVESDNAPGSAPPEDGEALECDWIIKVDQTIPVTEDGLTVNYTLVLIAQKTGGEDTIGDMMGGMMGTIGSSLALPESFPADEFPLAADANILDVF